MLRKLNKIVSFLPFIYISYLFSIMFYLAFISLFPNWLTSSSQIIIARIIFLIVGIIVLRNNYSTFEIKIEPFNLLVLLPLITALIVRLPLYFPFTDDLVLHLPMGDYASRMWNGFNFMPLGVSTYTYPLPDMVYTPFLYLLGIRATLTLNSFILIIWYFSLYIRFLSLDKNRTKGFLISLIFIYVFFAPHFIATFHSFMIDFVSLNVILEAFYQFINKNNNKTFAVILAIIGMILKQSTGIFVVPIMLYFIIINFRRICIKEVVIYLILTLVFFLRMYLDIGNPVMGLFNNIFKSSLFSTTTVHLSGSFGPKSGLLRLLTWPIVGQFSNHWAEGWVSQFSKYFFSLFSILPYTLSFIFLVKRNRLIYFIFFLSYLFWAYLFGYPRYYTALNLIVFIYLINDIRVSSIRLRPLALSVVVIIFSFLSFNSIQTDFGWRPFPYASVLGQNPTPLSYYLLRYKEGLHLMLKDTIPRIATFYSGDFKDFDVIMPIGRGWEIAYAYFANCSGIKVIYPETLNDYNNILSDDKINSKIKENLRFAREARSIMLVMEKNKEKSIDFKRLFIYDTFRCRRLDEAPKSLYFQTNDYFGSIVLYSCLKKT